MLERMVESNDTIVHFVASTSDVLRVITRSMCGHSLHVTRRFALIVMVVAACTRPNPSTPDGATPDARDAGSSWFPLRAFREIDDALLRLRCNHPDVGVVVVATRGDAATMLALDCSSWFAC